MTSTVPDSQKEFELRLSALRCERGERLLFEDLTLSLSAGQGLQLEGENGSGKTSLLRIIAGLSDQYEGDISWCGQDIRQSSYAFRRDLFYLGHMPGVKAQLTPLENLRWWSAIHSPNTEERQLNNALEQVGLSGYLHEFSHNLSAGQQRRVALARLYLSQHRLWILDEPFTAIDTSGVSQLEEKISEHLNRQGMVIITTHQSMQSAGFDRYSLSHQSDTACVQ